MEYIEATPLNMRKYGGEGIAAMDRVTGDTYSATPGDYFWLPDDEALTSSLDGEPLILAVTIQTHHEPLAAR